MVVSRRHRFLVDRSVQFALLRRFGLYGLYCLLTAILLVFFGQTLVGGELRPHQQLLSAVANSAPLVFALLAIFPFVAYDLLKLTNRFAGPLHRIRATLDALARGETIQPVCFREGDYWSDLGPKLNVLAARLQQLESGPADADEQRLRDQRQACV
jgi:hypothetical protein